MFTSLRTISHTTLSRSLGNQASQLASTTVAKRDVFGPQDAKSNLRLVQFYIPTNETRSEKKYRMKRMEVQDWNQEFWAAHNTQFSKEKGEFVKTFFENNPRDPKEPQWKLTADDLAVFYKSFLSQNLDKHAQYNKEWHSKNFQLLWLGILAYFSKCIKIYQCITARR